MSDEEHFRIEGQIGPRLFKVVAQTDYDIEMAFAELIDNSLQSFLDHEEEFVSLGQTAVTIQIDCDPGKIVIKDDAYGMNYKNFNRSLQLDAAPDEVNHFNEFGMGLKEAAGYFGNFRTVETAEFHSGIEYSGSTDLDEFSKVKPGEKWGFDCDKRQVSRDEHFTRITISRLNQKVTANDVGGIINDLSKIYASFIRARKLFIRFGVETVPPFTPTAFQDPVDGDKKYREFSSSVYFDGKKYPFSGKIWMLFIHDKKMSKGNLSNAGLSLTRNGRAIKLRYKPKYIFGAPNSFVSERIYGEIDVTSFPVSINKSKLTWSKQLEDAFVKQLSEISEFSEIVDYAKNKKRNKPSLPVEKTNKVLERTQEHFAALKNETIETDRQTTLEKSIPMVSAETSIKEAADVKPVDVPINGIVYHIRCVFVGENSKTDYPDWMKIETEDKLTNSYLLTIRDDLPFSLRYNLPNGEKGYDGLASLATIVAITELEGLRNGIPNSAFFVDYFMELARKIKW
jgi:hypothetical protein